MLKFKSNIQVTCNNVEEIAIVPGACCCSCCCCCCVSVATGNTAHNDSPNRTHIYVIQE